MNRSVKIIFFILIFYSISLSIPVRSETPEQIILTDCIKIDYEVPTLKSSNGERNKTVMFLHHSCGSNLINQGDVREYFTGNNTDFWDHGYNAQGVTDYTGSALGYDYGVPGDNTYADGFDNIFQQDDTDTGMCFSKLLHETDGVNTGVEFDVFAFKACYPENDNPTPADAFEKFKHYCNVRAQCDDFPDRIFVFVTAPPLNNDINPPTYLNRNNNTRKYCWDYITNGTFVEGHPNCFVWDWNYLLSNHTPTSNDYCGLREDYQIDNTNSHPNSIANSRHGPIFVQFVLDAIDTFEQSQNPSFSNEQQDFTMVQGDIFKSLTWTPTDPNSNYDSYWIQRNGTRISSGGWDGSQIKYSNLQSLTPSTYNFTCFVNNTNGYESQSSTIVSVVANQIPQITQVSANNSINIGTINFSLIWEASDSNGNSHRYWIERNQIQIANGTWSNSGNITYIEIDLLAIGTYNYTCFVNDTSQTQNYSTIIIYMQDNQLITFTFTIIGAAVVVGGFIAIVIKKRR